MIHTLTVCRVTQKIIYVHEEIPGTQQTTAFPIELWQGEKPPEKGDLIEIEVAFERVQSAKMHTKAGGTLSSLETTL